MTTKEELLARLDAADTDEEIAEIGQKLLELDAGDPYGKFIKWQLLERDEQLNSLDLLCDAHEAMRDVVESRENPAILEDDRDAEVYASIMINLGYALIENEKVEEALEAAKELANFDDEDIFRSRAFLYTCMLLLGLYSEILDSLESDPTESVVGEHARAIAMIETGAEPDEILDAVNYAISLSPNLPFFLAGIWEMEDPSEDEEYGDVLEDAWDLVEHWHANENRVLALAAQTFLFGYLTGRIDDKKMLKTLKDTYEQDGILARVEDARKKLKAKEESGYDPDELDAEALSETANILSDILAD